MRECMKCYKIPCICMAKVVESRVISIEDIREALYNIRNRALSNVGENLCGGLSIDAAIEALQTIKNIQEAILLLEGVPSEEYVR
jgi:hypothetical protein